ncbi:polysaccharide pyruvyl transferase family protein [Zophobihabitans entericus]|uniref:Polysaccharide pyruvyl transferase family protein n=1 Tax=Zophobihabitans entericus TaxID=1635327 RepID=A0A6G9IFM7_9GAMM|nr:polysaccharide pyruvyl transferase family protein [Zophobihabitans entericus]
MKNVVYSTTRQWNPGDEFILLGVKHLITKVIGKHNAIIFNRTPQIRRDQHYVGANWLRRFMYKHGREKYMDNTIFWDNSVKTGKELDYADLVIFAGSPEWRGDRLKELYSAILKYHLPAYFLGLGAAGDLDFNQFSEDEKIVLSNAKLITARDEYCNEQLSCVNSHYLPCPALFSSPSYKVVKEVKKVGLLYGSDLAVTNNNISTDTYNFMKRVYAKLLDKYEEKYEFEFVAHYIDELPLFKKDYPDKTIRYSYDSKDYLDIFADYDLIIGHRVHGIGMCASMGTPGIMIAHDRRATTVKGFLADMVTIDSSEEDFLHIVEKAIEEVETRSEALIKHRLETEKRYLDLLKPTF